MIILYYYYFGGFNLQENSNSLDLDLFISDKNKIIHLATGGVSLVDLNFEIKSNEYSANMRTVLSYRRVFRYEINENLQRNNLTKIEDYTWFFELMSKRGFYSYDKVDIDNNDDYKFQLISKPKYDSKLLLNSTSEVGNLNSSKTFNYNLVFKKAKKNFPEDFEPFELRDYI